MSGGHFDYIDMRIEDVAVEIDRLIETNNIKNMWNESHDYPSDITFAFRIAAKELRKASAMAHAIDWLVSGDDGEETFRKKWNNIMDGKYEY